jgi:hypothetical protein
MRHAHVDLRRSKEGTLCVLEVNPRYWWTLPASLFAGVNFPRIAVLDAFGESYPPPVYARTEYLKPGSIIKSKSDAKLKTILATLRIRLADPLPVIVGRILYRLHI